MLDKVWWTHIIKAHKFEEDIVKAAAEGKSVLLSLPENVPWKNTLLDMVEEQLKQENYKNAFEYVDCPEEEPGLFLLNNYCRREKRSWGFFLRSRRCKCRDRRIWRKGGFCRKP